MFQEGSIAWYANEIGKIQGRLGLCDDWARLNGGFQIIAGRERQRLEQQIESYKGKIQNLRATRGGPKAA